MPGQRAATLVESRLRQSAALHRETRTESSLDGSGSEEAAGRIEALCVRVADDVQDARSMPACDIGTMIDQPSSHASFPECRLYEQRIEFSVPVRPRQDGCKPDDDAIALRHEHMTVRDLLDWQGDRVRMLEQRVSIA